MATVELTESSFADTIKQSPIVFVDFWAQWCGPCRSFAPVYEKAALANTDIVFAKVDTEAEQGLAGSFEISSIPTLMAIRDGVVLYSQAGALPQEGLDNLISAIRAVDMEQVRTEISKASDGAT
jgi:thioredoxin 1